MPSACIEIKNETNRRYYARHRERLAKEQGQYRKENPDKNRVAKRKYYAKNRELVIARVKNYYERKPEQRKPRSQEKNHERNLRLKYGISVAEYNAMFLEQEGRCAICLKHQSELKRRLHVDHCHATGVIRGLLCQHCNNVLGLLSDDRDALQRAISYLQKVRE